jgi:hypothetical protein
MPTPTCPKCRRTIASDDVNVAKDVAYCRTCNQSHPLSTLTHGGIDTELNLSDPPVGAWYRSDGTGTVAGATHRSIGTAIGALLSGLFWNGIVSIFVLLASAATLKHLDVPLPDWFPAPNMDGSPMSVGMTIFLWIFLTPFIVIGLGMIFAFLSALAGKTEVRISGAEGMVFSGIGALGLRRRFETTSVKDIRIDERPWRDSDGNRQHRTCIIIETQQGKQFKLGSMLTNERRHFLAAALRRSLPA